jgi:hypothetical protein
MMTKKMNILLSTNLGVLLEKKESEISDLEMKSNVFREIADPLTLLISFHEVRSMNIDNDITDIRSFLGSRKPALLDIVTSEAQGLESNVSWLWDYYPSASFIWS